MKKKMVVLFLVAIMLLAAIPVFADSYTFSPWKHVKGGSSQQLCKLTASDTKCATLAVHGLNLYSQTHISFRPYKGNTPLMSSPTKVTRSAVYALRYTAGSVSVGNTIRLLASIPSKDRAVYSEFYGYVVL